MAPSGSSVIGICEPPKLTVLLKELETVLLCGAVRPALGLLFSLFVCLFVFDPLFLDPLFQFIKDLLDRHGTGVCTI